MCNTQHWIKRMRYSSIAHLTVALIVLGSCFRGGLVYGQGFGGGFGGGGTTRRTTPTSYPASTSAGQATFNYDPETRKVIAITDADTAKNISMVVSNLDRPAPQVLIKVVFLEATYTKNLDIGFEGSYTKNMGNSMTGIVNQTFGLAAAGANPTPPGAGIYQVLGSDFQATLRAIAQAGKTEILSRPSILARNNQQASISLGQLVPLVTGTVLSGVASTPVSTITYQSVGIILQVTPFITSDGMVEMVVAPQISELADRSQWVPTASGNGTTLSPVINQRSADTVVVVPDGQTAIIGGLMQRDNQLADSKIPFLGDIPLLGNLFKHHITSNTKTELLIFLTPHIVTNPTQLAGLATQERNNMHFRESMSEQELDRFLDKVPYKDDSSQKK
jgi:type II secretory pathway component GspD/PulD (secretin)